MYDTFYSLQQKRMFKDILKLVQTHKLIDKVNVRQDSVTVMETSQENPQNLHRSKHEGGAKLETDDKELQKLNSQIAANFPKIKLVFEKELGVGANFPDFGDVKKVFEEGNAKVAASPGQVLLVDVWATWCGPCQKPMSHNQEMIVKNGKIWGNKVRIIGVSVDESTDDIKQRVTSKGWSDVEHLTLGGWDHNHALISQFKIQGIPFVCLVDTFGKINFVGHPSSINLEERINTLLSSQGKNPNQKSQSMEKKEEEGEEAKQQVSLQTIEKLQKLMIEQHFKQAFGTAKSFSAVVRVHQQSEFGKISNSVNIKLTVKSSEKEQIEKFKHLIGDVKGIEFSENIIEDEEIPIGTNCSECNKKFQNQNEFYYWCKWQNNPTFRCIKCTQQKKDGHYNYGKNSILTKGKKFITSKKRLGNNILPPAPSVENSHNFGCNGCGNGPEPNTARYICIGCRPEPNHKGDYIDVCEACIKKYVAGDNQIRQNLKPDGHNQDHPFLRVLYNVEGYYKF